MECFYGFNGDSSVIEGSGAPSIGDSSTSHESRSQLVQDSYLTEASRVRLSPVLIGSKTQITCKSAGSDLAILIAGPPHKPSSRINISFLARSVSGFEGWFCSQKILLLICPKPGDIL